MLGNELNSIFPRMKRQRVARPEIAKPKKGKPIPITSPTAATNHIVAAVVIPVTRSPSRKTAAAPRKPIPVTTPAAIRVASLGSWATYTAAN